MLIDPDDLGSWMGKTLDSDRATQAIRIAEGWLLSATRMDPWPSLPQDTIPGDLAAWCLELSALAYVNNPKSMIQGQVENTALLQWEPDGQARRQAILDAARARYNTVALPRGSFPRAQCWPDEARPRGTREAWYR